MSFGDIASDGFDAGRRHLQGGAVNFGHHQSQALSYPQFAGYQISTAAAAAAADPSAAFGFAGHSMVGVAQGDNLGPGSYGGMYHTGAGGESAAWGIAQGYSAQQAPYVQISQHQNPLLVGSNQGPRSGRPQKPKRRRVATVAQRRAANIRERRRMFNLNESFDVLRKKVPTFAYEKRLSRIETLRLAITYISFLAEVCDGKDPDQVKLITPRGSSWAAFKKLAQNQTILNDSESGE